MKEKTKKKNPVTAWGLKSAGGQLLMDTFFSRQIAESVRCEGETVVRVEVREI